MTQPSFQSAWRDAPPQTSVPQVAPYGLTGAGSGSLSLPLKEVQGRKELQALR